jgi:hypothetical protein
VLATFLLLSTFFSQGLGFNPGLVRVSTQPTLLLLLFTTTFLKIIQSTKFEYLLKKQRYSFLVCLC